MSSDIFSVRLDDDTREKLDELINNSGLKNKEFVTRMIEVYEANLRRESLFQVKELPTLGHHLSRVEEIFTAYVKEADDRKAYYESKINELTESLNKAKAELLDKNRLLEEIETETTEKINAAQAEAALARENADKELQSMRDALRRAEESREQSARLATLAEKSASEAEARANALKEKANQAESYKAELEKSREEIARISQELQRAQEALERVKEDHINEIERLKERAEVERDRAVIETQRKDMAEIRNLQNELAKVREDKTILEIELARIKQAVPDTPNKE